MFSAEEYSKILEELIVKFQNLNNWADENETQAALDDVCKLLRIAKIEVRYFETPAHEMTNNGRSATMYDNGNADIDTRRVKSMRDLAENGAVTYYNFSPALGSDDWDTLELDKMRIVQRLIFTYNGRSVLAHVANNLTFNDITLEIPNLSYFLKIAGSIMSRSKIGGYGVAYFNLRRFAVVNNQVGRPEGTEIMKKYVHGLQEMYEGEECVCRIGGDNFVTLFKKERIDDVLKYLSGVTVKSDNVYAKFVVSAYVGVYMVNPAECKTPMDLMDRASVVANIAKRGGGSPVIFYNAEIEERVRLSKLIEDMVPDALRNEEFLVYYQPKVSLKDYTLVGAEALCRWKHDDEMIQPFRFIPVLERSKLVCELDYYMLDHVCRDMRRWLDEGKKVVEVSVNLSRMHLGDASLLDDIIGIIDKYGIPHEYIEIELTETTTDVDYGELKRVVTGLREAGIKTAVDDFGVGYSSLNLIRELPWNVLKIDKSFLPDGTGNDKEKRTMLKYVIAMAQELGLDCIVEGVETLDQIMLMKECNCFNAQGFYFDRPLPVDVFDKRLMM